MSNFVAVDPNFKLEIDLLEALLLAVSPSPRTLTVSLLLQYEEWDQLVKLGINPLSYRECDYERFKDDYLVSVFLSKSPNVPLNVDVKVEALRSFYKAEDHCAVFARSFLSLDPSGPVGLKLKRIRNTFRGMLGPLTKRAIRRIERMLRFGPGATTRVAGKGSTIADKYAGSPHLTESLYPFYKGILGERWHESARDPEIVEGNEFFSVQKNALTERGACKEPDLNQMGQLAIGAELRERLSSVGNSIEFQHVNQRMVARAYDDELSTIDLSSASDTIAYIFVCWLLPENWRYLLGLFRCTKTLVNVFLDGSSMKYVSELKLFRTLRKYSSMGNGFTFELETLIFLAICRTIVPPERWGDVAVYGDDMIVPSSYYREVCEALTDCGFIVNQKKSYGSGLFFESCGADYFCGKPVRPFYARGENSDNPEEGLIPYSLQLANALRLYTHRVNNGLRCEKRFLPAYKMLVKHVPLSLIHI